MITALPIFWLRLKFFNVLTSSFFEDVSQKYNVNSSLNMTVFNKSSYWWKNKKQKEIFEENHFHNSLRFFCFTQFPFTTTETMRDYYLWAYYKGDASRGAEQLRTYDPRKLENIRKVSKLRIMIVWHPVFLPK